MVSSTMHPPSLNKLPPSDSAETRQVVCVVDDDQATRSSLCALLESDGLEVMAFKSGEEFLERYEGRDLGCVVSDYRLPGISGLELQETMRRAESALPFIIVSGFADVQVAVRAMRQGAITLLEKPYRRDELIRQVRHAMALNLEIREHLGKVRSARERMALLTTKELDVLRMVVSGKSNKAVAYELGIGLRTVERRRRSIFNKMGVDTAVELVEIVSLAQQAKK